MIEFLREGRTRECNSTLPKINISQSPVQRSFLEYCEPNQTEPDSEP